jgi:hypothetical protein
VVPTSRTSGLSPDEAKIANAQRLIAEKLGSLNYTAGGEKSMERLVQEFDASATGQGTPEQKLQSAFSSMNANAALADLGPYMKAAEGGRTGDAGRAAPADKIKQARAWLASPEARKDPQTAAGVAARLRALGAM